MVSVQVLLADASFSGKTFATPAPGELSTESLWSKPSARGAAEAGTMFSDEPGGVRHRPYPFTDMFGVHRIRIL